MTGLFSTRSALIGAVLLATGTCATAQEMHVAVSKVESGDWLWVAIYSGVAASPQVESVVALRDPASATEENLRVVQYTRGATWTSQAWTTAETWEAINWIKADLGLSDDEDAEWGICNDTGVEESQAPVDYTDGMLASDPWAPIVLSLPDPASYIETLVDLGYQAADLSVDNDAACTSDAVLEGLAGEFESMVANSDITVLSVGEGGVNCEFFAGPRPTPPVKPTKPVTAPPWTPRGTPGLPTVPTGWTPGGVGPTPWACRTVLLGGGSGVNCICSRSRLWGKWETKTCCFFFTCIRWHVVTVLDTCTDVRATGPCPAVPTSPPFFCTTTPRY